MQGDDPPYLSEGTAVSAKYKGAFCEAKVSKVVRLVKCKVTFKMGLGAATVHDENIKGTLRVGQLVQARHSEKKEFFDATITKVQDCSQYTVVFDDGDITTLKRTALCLKSGRHFNESETLDQLPLTHPEHFGNPVVGGRRGRRNRQLKEDSSEGEGEEDNEPDLEMYTQDIGRVVSVESSEKKRNKDNWFPGLIVMPSAQPTVKINVKDEFLVRSFKDGRYYTVPKKEVTEFTKEMGAKVENAVLTEAVEKALKYLNEDALPDHWEKSILFNPAGQYSDSEENFTDTSDDEPTEEKDHFVAQLYKFMDDSGTPLNRTPTVGNRDVDLYRLFRVVQKLGGYNRVTNQNKWRTVALRLKFTNSQNTFNQVKMVYRKCLHSYEAFYRTLGCTMSDYTRTSKKNRSRPLIRDKDRVTPVQSPRPDSVKEEPTEDKEKKVEEKKTEVEVEKIEERPKLKKEKTKIEVEDKKKVVETSDLSSGEATDHLEPVPSTSKEVPVRVKKIETPQKLTPKEKKSKIVEKVKIDKEKDEEIKEETKERPPIQQTRSKGPVVVKPKEPVLSPDRLKIREQKTPMREAAARNMAVKVMKKEERRGRKRIISEEKSPSESNNVEPVPPPPPAVNIGDKLMVYYGPTTHESKRIMYEAKVIEVDTDGQGPIYLVHYTGWNTRYDEWIQPQRIAENLSVTTKAKKLKQGSMTNKSSQPQSGMLPSTSGVKSPSKRGRGASITGKTSTTSEPPRSTTPSSVTSSSSRTKSPATPASRTRASRQGDATRRTRRTSVQTDISLQSDSESVSSEGEPELLRLKTGNRSEDSSDAKAPKKRLIKTKADKKKDDDDTEKEEEIEKPKKPRKLKKQPEVKLDDDSDDDSVTHPKGRDFDLNQIRSELKGFTKIKMAENSEKDTASSDDSTTPDVKIVTEDSEDKKDKIAESTSSSEDVYEFKEPEPFEFETHKIVDEKTKKRFGPRVLESPKKKSPKAKEDDKKSKEEDAKKNKNKRTPKKDVDDDDDDLLDKELKLDEPTDPFDKLVESPSFHIGKATSEKPDDVKRVTKNLNVDLLFKELPSSIEDESDERLDISDTEDTGEPLFTHKEQLFLGATFSKPSPNPSLDPDTGFTSKSDDRKTVTTSDDDDIIKTTMQNVLQFDNDSTDLLISQGSEEDDPRKDDTETITLNRVESEEELRPAEITIESEKLASLSRQIAPVFQETDTALMKDLYSQSQFTVKDDLVKDINYKIGTKVADSLLQKLSKGKVEVKIDESKDVDDDDESKDIDDDDDDEDKMDIEEIVHEKPMEIIETKVNKPIVVESKVRIPVESKVRIPEVKVFEKPKTRGMDKKHDLRKSNRKAISKEFIDDSDDSDSSDSDERLIMDEDSQTSVSLDAKPEPEKLDTKPEEPPEKTPKRNFAFEPLPEEQKDEIKMDVEVLKDEEADTDLYCGETIPGSPAPAPVIEGKVKIKSEEEMPFASVPCGSSGAGSCKAVVSGGDKGCAGGSGGIDKIDKVGGSKDRGASPVAVAEAPENRDVSAVLDNTPPTTPESILSNLSPRRENCDLSPHTADNDSCKSNEAEPEYINQRRGSTNKVASFSEEDTQMTGDQCSSSKKREDLPGLCKKRRRSCKTIDDIPAKRGRKPTMRSHHSDSDDMSEHSAQGNVSLGNIESRLLRSPRSLKYNFCTALDPGLDNAQRIAVLYQKIADIRKTYAHEKAELAGIERRRKKIRRREREALKAAKQEMVCT